jgi:DNA-binding GntR family transcriptional regulator
LTQEGRGTVGAEEVAEAIHQNGGRLQPDFGKSLPDQITEALADEIIERRILPGSKLPELALAERFGTSRAPIREALYKLTQSGLVERKPRRGAIVQEYGRQEIEELYRVRTLLERLALERICDEPRMIRACVELLDPVVREMETFQNDNKRYHELNFSFHKSIILLSSSSLLERLYERIEGPLKVVLRRSFSTEGAVPKSFGEHLSLLKAIEEADVERGCQLLLKHDEDGMQRALASTASTDADASSETSST